MAINEDIRQTFKRRLARLLASLEWKKKTRKDSANWRISRLSTQDLCDGLQAQIDRLVTEDGTHPSIVPNTITRWRTGKSLPKQHHLEALVRLLLEKRWRPEESVRLLVNSLSSAETKEHDWEALLYECRPVLEFSGELDRVTGEPKLVDLIRTRIMGHSSSSIPSELSRSDIVRIKKKIELTDQVVRKLRLNINLAERSRIRKCLYQLQPSELEKLLGDGCEPWDDADVQG